MVEPRAPGRSRPFSGRQDQRPEGARANTTTASRSAGRMVEPRAPGRSRPFSGRQGQRPEGVGANTTTASRCAAGWWSRGHWAKPTIFRSARPAARRRGGQTAGKTEGAGADRREHRRCEGRTAAGQRPVGKTGGHKKTPTFLRVFKVRTGRFELPTSCLSSKRSKPTELSPRRLGLQR